MCRLYTFVDASSDIIFSPFFDPPGLALCCVSFTSPSFGGRPRRSPAFTFSPIRLQTHHLQATPKLVLSIPTPDPRAERWGSTAAGRSVTLANEFVAWPVCTHHYVECGGSRGGPPGNDGVLHVWMMLCLCSTCSSLNLSVEADRVAAATWFVDVAMDRVAAMGLQHIEMVGFYWYSELIVPADYSLVRAVASHVHSANQDGAGGVGAATSADQGQGAPRGQRKLIFTWIPYFEATGWQSWAELGFDFATMQPNWAFHNHSCCRNATALFARVANDTKCRGMGLEMELPLAVRATVERQITHMVGHCRPSFIIFKQKHCYVSTAASLLNYK